MCYLDAGNRNSIMMLSATDVLNVLEGEGILQRGKPEVA